VNIGANNSDLNAEFPEGDHKIVGGSELEPI